MNSDCHGSERFVVGETGGYRMTDPQRGHYERELLVMDALDAYHVVHRRIVPGKPNVESQTLQRSRNAVERVAARLNGQPIYAQHGGKTMYEFYGCRCALCVYEQRRRWRRKRLR